MSGINGECSSLLDAAVECISWDFLRHDVYTGCTESASRKRERERERESLWYTNGIYYDTNKKYKQKLSQVVSYSVRAADCKEIKYDWYKTRFKRPIRRFSPTFISVEGASFLPSFNSPSSQNRISRSEIYEGRSESTWSNIVMARIWPNFCYRVLKLFYWVNIHDCLTKTNRQIAIYHYI